jgi:hypothetical protein
MRRAAFTNEWSRAFVDEVKRLLLLFHSSMDIDKACEALMKEKDRFRLPADAITALFAIVVDVQSREEDKKASLESKIKTDAYELALPIIECGLYKEDVVASGEVRYLTRQLLEAVIFDGVKVDATDTYCRFFHMLNALFADPQCIPSLGDFLQSTVELRYMKLLCTALKSQATRQQKNESKGAWFQLWRWCGSIAPLTDQVGVVFVSVIMIVFRHWIPWCSRNPTTCDWSSMCGICSLKS